MTASKHTVPFCVNIRGFCTNRSPEPFITTLMQLVHAKSEAHAHDVFKTIAAGIRIIFFIRIIFVWL